MLMQVSGSLYGALIGSILAFNIADFLGRRRELILSSVSYLIGALLTAAAPNFPIMVVGRFFYGIGIGLAMHAAPMYIAETAPSQIRGMLISLKEFFIVLGMLLGYIAGSLFVEVVSGWRYMYATSTPLCLIMGIGMCWLPASPRWLLLCAIQGKRNIMESKENATRCLCRLRGQASPDLVSEQVDLILDELSYVDQERQAGFSEIFQGKCLKAMIIGCGLVFFQQVVS
jgi:MFS family permease